MIVATRMRGERVALNPELVTSVECTPDTTIRFLNGETVLVRESFEEVVARVLAYRRSLVAPAPLAAQTGAVASDATASPAANEGGG